MNARTQAWAVAFFLVAAVAYGESYTINSVNYDGKQNPWNSGGTGLMAVGQGDSGTWPLRDIWYDGFAGPSGTYQILLDGSVDDDCATSFEVLAGGRLLASGTMPVGGSNGYNQRDYDLGGGHQVNNGERITFRASSSGKCYSRWRALVFTVEGGGGGGNTAPTASISAPGGTDSFVVGDAISYVGSASDTEDGALSGTSLVWEYDISGDGRGRSSIGTGGSGSFSAPAHPTGTDPYTLTIYLTATDSGGLSTETSVAVSISAGGGGGPPPPSPSGGISPVKVADGAYPDLAVDAAGNVHLVYVRSGTLYYQKFDAGSGSWSAEQNTGLPAGTVNRSDPEVVTDSADAPHVFVGSSYAYWSGSSWVPIDPGADRDTAMAIDSQDNVYICKRGGVDGGYLGIRVRLAGAASFASRADADVSNGLPLGRNDHVYGHISVNPVDDSLHVVYRHASPSSCGYRGSTDGGQGWFGGGISGDDAEAPSGAVADDGTIYAVSGNGTVHERTGTPSSWNSLGRAVTAGGRDLPAISTDQAGNVYVTSFRGRYNVRSGGTWSGAATLPALSGSSLGFAECAGGPGSFAYVVWEEGSSVNNDALAGTSDILFATLASDGTVGSGGGTINQRPTALISASTTSGTTGEQLSFDGSGSSDSDGTLVSFDWDFGDGSAGASGALADHVWTAPGDYTVTLTVVDDKGASDSDTVQVFITGSDTTAPTIALVALGVSGLVDDPTVTSVTVDGAAVSVTASGTFDGEAAVGTTAITIDVTASDAAGNLATRTLSIVP